MGTATGRPSACGRCGICKRCKAAAYTRAWWARLTPAERAAKIAARDLDKAREQDRRKMRKRRAVGTPEQKCKIAARTAARLALARGDLQRGPCEQDDGCAGPIHAHHDDYEKPLDVRWLCRRHHEELHMQIGIV